MIFLNPNLSLSAWTQICCLLALPSWESGHSTTSRGAVLSIRKFKLPWCKSNCRPWRNRVIVPISHLKHIVPKNVEVATNAWRKHCYKMIFVWGWGGMFLQLFKRSFFRDPKQDTAGQKFWIKTALRMALRSHRTDADIASWRERVKEWEQRHK